MREPLRVGQYVRQRVQGLPWRIGVVDRVHDSTPPHDGVPPIRMRIGVRVIVGAEAYKHDLSWFRDDELDVVDVSDLAVEDLQAVLADDLRQPS